MPGHRIRAIKTESEHYSNALVAYPSSSRCYDVHARNDLFSEALIQWGLQEPAQAAGWARALYVETSSVRGWMEQSDRQPYEYPLDIDALGLPKPRAKRCIR